MKQKLIDRCTLCLKNENGGPNLEELIGIGVGLAVGSGLYQFGEALYTWLAGTNGASTEIAKIKKPGTAAASNI